MRTRRTEECEHSHFDLGEFLPNPPAERKMIEVHFQDYVNYNASAFTDAYFDFASIRVYQDSRKNRYRLERQHFK